MSKRVRYEEYVRRCIELATAAAKAGDGPFGSLIVRNERIVAEGCNRATTSNDVSAHAEIEAVRTACRTLDRQDLSEFTLYTNAEPCFMCSYVIRQVGIRHVVIGAPADARGGVSSRYAVLTDPDIAGWGDPPSIVTGVLEEECVALLHEYGYVHI